MATIKSYTDLEQSKKLVEILPTESADMCWYLATKGNPNAMFNEGYNKYGDFEIPCWSLAALLSVLPSATLDSSNDHYYRLHCVERFTEWHNNPVDACVEMVIKLNEQKQKLL